MWRIQLHTEIISHHSHWGWSQECKVGFTHTIYCSNGVNQRTRGTLSALNTWETPWHPFTETDTKPGLEEKHSARDGASVLCCGLSGEGVDPFPGEQDKIVPHASVQALHGGLIYPGERGKGKETEGIQVRERSKNVRNDTILRCVSPFKSLWKIELKDKFTLVQKSLKSMHFFFTWHVSTNFLKFLLLQKASMFNKDSGCKSNILRKLFEFLGPCTGSIG